MTKLLDQAIAKARELPEAEQDQAAALFLEIIANRDEPIRLDDRTRAAVRRGLDEMRQGRIATDEEVAAVFNRYR